MSITVYSILLGLVWFVYSCLVAISGAPFWMAVAYIVAADFGIVLVIFALAIMQAFAHENLPAGESY